MLGIKVGWRTYTGLICILLLAFYPVTSLAESVNIVLNPGFESGTTNWVFATNGAGRFLNDVPGPVSPHAGHINILTPGTSVQLYQKGLVLEPKTLYRLSFKAYSNTGHDLSISLIKHGSPYTNYGLSNYVVNLGTTWKDYSIQFNTSGFSGTVNDARLMFWLAPYDAAGDQYYIDDVTLALVFPPEPDTTPPNITLWYGNYQTFGQIGVPQQWVNILGNVQDASGVSSLNYSLNNGIITNLSIGPDTRLESSGDFNVEINHTDLLCGDNQLVITAADTKGNSRNEIVSINYFCNNVWPKNYTINWSDTASIQEAAQIVDGRWIKETNSIRPAVIGYDRLVTIGDMTWKDFEITAPITLNTPLNSLSGPNFGFITRWQGHWDWNITYPAYWRGKQPRPAWYPLGALGVYIWVPSIKDYRLQIIGNNMKVIANDTSGKHLSVGVPYIFKMRAETNGTTTRYSLKVWEQNRAEPAEWTISGYGPTGELKQGSVLLAANNANVSFGNVTIRSLSREDPFPEIRNVWVEVYENNATVRWNTSKPASGKVSYGLSAAYENGSVYDGIMVLSHAILLNNLQPGTTYHYKINSTDSGGKSANTSDMTFTTKPISPPVIISQPLNQTILNGSAATFSVAANGTEPLSYQWKKNGVNITGATGSSYITPVMSLLDNGTKFSVLVRNSYGSVTSNEVRLTVIEAPLITWWDTSRRFRVPVTVDPAGFERYEKPVDVSVNFTQMLRVYGQAGTFDENSIRVVETDSLGTILNDSVSFQFDKDPGFDAVTKASGTIVFIMNGTTQANEIRHYHFYFGTSGGSYTPLSVAPLITLTDNVTDEGQNSYRIEAFGSTYFFQKGTGGFSSWLDASGNDWISYTTSVPDGKYRGIPNSVNPEGYFHPWATACCTSTILSRGPMKIRIRSVTNDGKWESLWDIYPQYATMTMVKADHNYWFLYEGTPGGTLEPNKDFMVRSDGTRTFLNRSWNTDIPGNEWAYFSDPAVNRSLFAAHHEDDTSKDTYWPFKTDILTVFGFGRTDNPAVGYLSTVPQHFTIGLMNGTEFPQNSKIIYSAYKDLTITKSIAEKYNTVMPLGIVIQPADQKVETGQTATFSILASGTTPLIYQWQKNGVNISGATNASYTTLPAIQSDSGSIYRVVVTNTIGSVTSNPAMLTISPPPKQVVFLDVVYTHTTTNKAFSSFSIPFGFPSNLVSPIDYAHGTAYQRIQVITKPSTKIVQYQQCVFQDGILANKQVCTTASKLQFSSIGTYYANQSMTSLFQYSNISWNRALFLQELIVKDGRGWPVDDRYGFLGTWIGSPDFSLYYPMQVRYTYIIVAPGGGEPIWPK
ncbi:Carbohydrate binding domain protein [uncultured archaeon]|nr:Carbohydrate binding domain protein [uncultured archaeon]